MRGRQEVENHCRSGPWARNLTRLDYQLLYLDYQLLYIDLAKALRQSAMVRGLGWAGYRP